MVLQGPGRPGVRTLPRAPSLRVFAGARVNNTRAAPGRLPALLDPDASGPGRLDPLSSAAGVRKMKKQP